LLLAVDDLQWADLGTISLLFHLGRQLVGCPILIIGAYRPEEVALGRPDPASGSGQRERHPLEPVVNEFQRDFGDIMVSLGRAESRDFVEAYLDCEPNRLGAAFRQMLFRQTRGHPLFTIELLRGLQEQGDLVRDAQGRWIEGPALDWERLPARVEAVIAERINRLAELLQAAMRVASVEGEVFTAEVLARVRAADEREVVGLLSRELDRRHRLIRAQGVLRVDGQRMSQYRFRHILFQRYLYNSLDDVEREYLHEAVGDTLEALHAAQPEATAAIAGQLAWHFQEAGMAPRAIRYLYQAGDRALRLCAYQEAIGHLTRGLELLLALPAPVTQEQRLARDEQELALQLALGMAGIGYGSFGIHTVGAAYSRARELCQKLDKISQLCVALGELSVFHYVRAEHHQARELAEEALSLAQGTQDPLLVALGHWYLGLALFALGEYSAALTQFESTSSFYDPQQHHEPFVSLRGSDAGMSAMAYEACCLWSLGYPEQAARRSEEVLALARALAHPFSLADVLCFAGCKLYRMRRDAQALWDCTEELIALSHRRAIPGWAATATGYQGEAAALLGQYQDGIALMCGGIAGQQSIDVQLYLPGTMCTLAQAEVELGLPDQGLTTLADALAMVEETDERYWEAELYRVRGELLLQQGDAAEAEASLRQAIGVAQRQKAKSWELRAATVLARLWHEQGRTAEAHALLAEVYGWFTEGFDTPDLREAATLLQETRTGVPRDPAPRDGVALGWRSR
jgi:predicted ATPase